MRARFENDRLVDGQDIFVAKFNPLIRPYLVHRELVTDRAEMSAAYRDYRQS